MLKQYKREQTRLLPRLFYARVAAACPVDDLFGQMACHNDDTLGPVLPQQASGHCRTFDFTLAFEDLVFTLTPCLALLPIIVYSICRAVRRPKLVDWRLCWLAKSVSREAWHVFRLEAIVLRHHAKSLRQTLYFVLFAFQLAVLSLYAAEAELNTRSRLTIPAISVELLTIASLAVLSFLQHSRSPCPSVVVQFFLLITLLLDTARLRSTWLISDRNAVAVLKAAVFVTKALLLVVESLRKTRHFVIQGVDLISPEGNAGIFARTMMLWLIPLFLRGYRQKLTAADLHRLDDGLDSRKVSDALEDAWSHIRTARRRRLALALARAFAGSLALVHVPRLALVAFALTQPLLITAALTYVQDHASMSIKYGQALIGAFALNYLAIAVRPRNPFDLFHQATRKLRLTILHEGLYPMVSASNLSPHDQGQRIADRLDIQA